MPTAKLTFQAFSPAEFTTYQAWFKDPKLQKFLGSIDEEWLTHILHDTEGVEYAVFQSEELVAVVGLVFGPQEITITNIAVAPDHQNQGLGSQVLRQLVEKEFSANGKSWQAFVDKDNEVALHFFAKNGWLATDEGEMVRYVS